LRSTSNQGMQDSTAGEGGGGGGLISNGAGRWAGKGRLKGNGRNELLKSDLKKGSIMLGIMSEGRRGDLLEKRDPKLLCEYGTQENKADQGG